MATKLGRKKFPTGHGPDDFQCFGPPATKDGEGIIGTMICDMGCFTQDGKDTNKFYHGAVVQSKKDQKWYAYFEWGRQTAGGSAADFLFVDCASKAEAEKEYTKQLRSKNDKRGVWVNHAALGTILQAKEGEDCYLVRPQATRSTGLPDAKTITSNEGAKAKPIAAPMVGKSKAPAVDAPTLSLMRDLNLGAISYTRSSMADSAIPTQATLDFGRCVLTEAQKRLAKVGPDVKDQVNDVELKSLTSQLYSKIPKKKDRNAAPETWLLSQNNIVSWLMDIDAFESALYATDLGDNNVDPFAGLNLRMRHLTTNDPAGEFVHNWFPTATRMRHGFRGLRIKNLWQIDRDGDDARLESVQKKIAASPFELTERPRYQPKIRADLEAAKRRLYADSNTYLGIHGTRSVNVSGLMRESFRLPKDLVGVKITAWMFGPGVYMADDWGKSVGYTSHSGSRYAKGGGSVANRNAFMFLADTVLGASYVAPSDHPFTKAPDRHHSVCGKAGYTKGWGGALANNEFIVYSTDQVRIRYLVEFDVN